MQIYQLSIFALHVIHHHGIGVGLKIWNTKRTSSDILRRHIMWSNNIKEHQHVHVHVFHWTAIFCPVSLSISTSNPRRFRYIYLRSLGPEELLLEIHFLYYPQCLPGSNNDSYNHPATESLSKTSIKDLTNNPRKKS
jgi:hypothetical protein